MSSSSPEKIPLTNGDSPDNQQNDDVIIKTEERETWGRKLEFILTCVGYCVGLGNVWRYRNFYQTFEMNKYIPSVSWIFKRPALFSKHPSSIKSILVCSHFVGEFNDHFLICKLTLKLAIFSMQIRIWGN